LKVTNGQRIQLHQRWWAGTNTEPLALIYTPLHSPYGGLDIKVPVAEIAFRKRSNAQVAYRAPMDTLVTAYVDFATALIPAMLGAGFEYDEHTTWAIPTVHSIQEVKIPSFQTDLPYYQAYIERVEAILAGWSWETYLPANYAYLGPVDVLAGLLGPERLALELYQHPDQVKGKALELAQFLGEMVQIEIANDINNRDIRKVIAAAQQVHERGLPLQVSSWEHPLTEAEIDLIIQELDPRGLIIALHARSYEEVLRLYARVKGRPFAETARSRQRQGNHENP
jgi:hypothetical protein